MKLHRIQILESIRRIRMLMGVAALVGALTPALPQSVQADSHITPPSAPSNLQTPVGNTVFLVGHAVGTQQYICQYSETGFTWAFFGPQATLFKLNGQQILTHFLSPNPWESGLPRATWRDSKDSSAVWAAPIASSSDVAFVAPGAIPWLLLEVVGDQPGPNGGDSLAQTTFIQRLNTSGGVAPSTGCAMLSDIGKKALTPYTADYFFYELTDDE